MSRPKWPRSSLCPYECAVCHNGFASEDVRDWHQKMCRRENGDADG